MAKKLFTIIILASSLFMPIFGVTIHVPGSSYYTSSSSDYNIWKGSASDRQVYKNSKESQNQIFGAFNYINTYLWRAFSAVCAWAVVFGWYRLITAHGDKKAMKQAIWSLIWSAIGVVIAMLSYTIVTLLANLNP